MKLRLLTTALVAMAGAFATQSANAQYTAAAGGEDMILAFQDGSDNDIQVDLGSITQFLGASPTFSSINLDADLVAQYGSSWFSSSAVAWSVTGVNNSGATENGFLNESIFVTSPLSTADGALSLTSLGSPNSDIEALYTPSGVTPGIAANTDIIASSTAGSYSLENSAGTDQTGQTVQNTFGLGTASTLYLDVLQPSTSANHSTKGTVVVEPGIFSINSAGLVTFTAAPEPSTYVLMLVGALLLAFQINRRKSSVSKL